MLIELLPLLDGWKDIAKDLPQPVKVKKGSPYVLDKVTYPGWIYSIQVTVTGDPEVILRISWYDPIKGPMKAEIQPASLLALGFDEPNDSAPYIANWDDSTATYTIAFTPSLPLPFKASPKMPRVVAVEGVTNDIEITAFSQEGFAIYDMPAFLESLRRILTPETAQSIMREAEKYAKLVESEIQRFQGHPRW